MTVKNIVGFARVSESELDGFKRVASSCTHGAGTTKRKLRRLEANGGPGVCNPFAIPKAWPRARMTPSTPMARNKPVRQSATIARLRPWRECRRLYSARPMIARTVLVIINTKNPHPATVAATPRDGELAKTN